MALELVHGKVGTKNHEVLDLGISAWNQLVALGEAHGWQKPTVEPSDNAKQKRSDCNFTAYYYWDQPAEVQQHTAQEWADALERSLKIPELKDATLPPFLKEHDNAAKIALADSNYARLCGLSREMVERFITFLRKGEFIYAVWD